MCQKYARILHTAPEMSQEIINYPNLHIDLKILTNETLFNQQMKLTICQEMRMYYFHIMFFINDLLVEYCFKMLNSNSYRPFYSCQYQSVICMTCWC